MSGLRVVVAALVGALIGGGTVAWLARTAASAKEAKIRELSVRVQLAEARASAAVLRQMLAPKPGDFPPWHGRRPQDEGKLLHPETDQEPRRSR